MRNDSLFKCCIEYFKSNAQPIFWKQLLAWRWTLGWLLWNWSWVCGHWQLQDLLFRRKSDQGSAYTIWFIKSVEEEKSLLCSSSAGRNQGLGGITSKGDNYRERKARQHFIWQEVAYSSPTYILIRVLMDRYEYVPDPEDEPRIDDSTWWANPRLLAG